MFAFGTPGFINGADGGVLKIDLASPCETPEYLPAFIALANDQSHKLFHVECMVTKASPAAQTRDSALLLTGYEPFLQNHAINKGGINVEIGIQVYAKGSVEAVEFYQRAFGAELGYNVKHPDGTFLHAELVVNGKSFLAVGEAVDNFITEVPPKYPAMSFGMVLDNEEAVRRVYDVLSESAAVCTPLRVLPWSDCCADLVDRFGVYWYLTVPQHRPAE